MTYVKLNSWNRTLWALTVCKEMVNRKENYSCPIENIWNHLTECQKSQFGLVNIFYRLDVFTNRIINIYVRTGFDIK